jgi:hypothetical protein
LLVINTAGSAIELKYALLTFGIDCKEAVTNKTGSDHQSERLASKYLTRRLEIEKVEKEADDRQEAGTGVIFCPQPNDVILGRGRPFRKYPGNLRWSRLIEAQLERYQTCGDKFGKTCISIEVIKAVQEYGGRFIQQTEEGWKVLEDSIAREKTLRAFRPRINRNVGHTAYDSDPGDTNAEGPVKRMKNDPTDANVL